MSGAKIVFFLVFASKISRLVSAFVMVSTVWSVSGLLFFYSSTTICKGEVRMPPVLNGVGVTLLIIMLLPTRDAVR